MVEITKTIRNIDADAYRLFRAKAVEMGYSTGAAMNEALRLWVNAKSRPRMTVRAEMEAGERGAQRDVIEETSTA
jgi:hypothetical protein